MLKLNLFFMLVSLLLTVNLVAAENKDTKSFAQELRKDYPAYFKKDYYIQKHKNRLSLSIAKKLKHILKKSVNEAKQANKLNINLISWPSEDKLIYNFGEKILKDKR